MGDRLPAESALRDAVCLLDRIYGRKAGYQLSDSDMVEEWIDQEIGTFIRKHGSFAEQRAAFSEHEQEEGNG